MITHTPVALDEGCAQTPLSDLVSAALDKMASGEWRLILEHPDPSKGTSLCSFEVGKEIARRAYLSAVGGEAGEMREQRDKQMDYSIDLQRIIEDLCCDRDIRTPATAARHHYNMAVAYRARLKAQRGVVKALEDAEKAFEEIRLILVKHLDEPERSAFWKAVCARDAVRAALAAPVSQEPVAWTKEGKPMGELVLIPRDLAERVTEIANRNEQSAEGDRLAALLSSPAPSLPEDVERYSASRSLQGIVQDPNGRLVAYSDFQSLSSQLAGARAELKMLHTHNLAGRDAIEADRDRLAAELERKVVVAKEALEATREAIALHRSYERTPTDRGGSLGPKGKARSAWIEAEAFAEGRVDTALASLEDRT